MLDSCVHRLVQKIEMPQLYSRMAFYNACTGHNTKQSVQVCTQLWHRSHTKAALQYLCTDLRATRTASVYGKKKSK